MDETKKLRTIITILILLLITISMICLVQKATIERTSNLLTRCLINRMKVPTVTEHHTVRIINQENITEVK